MTLQTPTPDEALPWLRLSLAAHVAPRAQQRLLHAFGSPEAIFAADARQVAAVTTPAVAEALARGPLPQALERAQRWLAQPGNALVPCTWPCYPQWLLNIADPPAALFVRGRLELLNAPAMAVVGSRNATPGGMRDAQAFAHAFSDAGLCVVSGMALGIDAAAHRGGLQGVGSSIAVLGTGPDIIYPSRNRELAHALAEQGALLSEFAPGTPSIAGNFPRRNRLISGLARGVLVVEAAQRSGSLITAREAADQNREVFAIPGSIHSPLSKGCHQLIREGAKLVDRAEDVLAEIGWEPPREREPDEDPEEEALLEAMEFAPVCLDQVAQRTGLPAASIAARLSQLEVQGRIVALPGGWFQRLLAEA